MHKKVTSFLLLGAVVTACSDSTSSIVGASTALAPMAASAADASVQVVPNEYLVVLKRGANLDEEVARARAAGAEVMDVWRDALVGFSVRIPGGKLNALRTSRNINWVEPNAVMHVSATYPCSIGGYANCSWGLDRISESFLPMDGNYVVSNRAPTEGGNATAYVIDTGIRFTHSEFGGRASSGYDFVNNDANAIDDHGHGTHVSGTIGGAKYGVAKKVKLVALKVCNSLGSCPTNAIISGVNWVTANKVQPAVANMSLGGGANAAIDAAVTNSIAAGIVYGISAGNSNANACNYSPARVATAITVAASGSYDGLVPPAQPDARASYSNYGTCVDIFAPGSQIKSAWYTSDVATNTISGTSMASPHVVGVAALYRSEKPAKTVAQVTAALVGHATNGVITNPGAGSPNKLLNSSLPTIAWNQ
ncbi:MAG: Extracellular serine proteinase [Gemmatimonadaceae bacterium]|nr:Extracellular serine proteinase [Gemmatimonadaceae bacterium]